MVELVGAVGGGEHAAREQEERVDRWEQEEQVGLPDQKPAVDPWTFGESNPAGSPRGPAASFAPNRPGQPIRRSSRERAAGITSHLCPSQGACRLQATGGLASRIAAALTGVRPVGRRALTAHRLTGGSPPGS